MPKHGFHGKGRGGKGGKPDKFEKRASTSKREEAESAALKARIAELAPSHGTTYSPPEGISPLFTDFPLSKYTLTGLSEQKYIQPTAIQLATIPHALAGWVSAERRSRSLPVHALALCTCAGTGVIF